MFGDPRFDRRSFMCHGGLSLAALGGAGPLQVLA